MSEIVHNNVTNVEFVKVKSVGHSSLIRPFPTKVQQKYDYMLKLIIVGDSGVGKTNIISAFCDSEYHFALNHVPTIGVDFSSKIIQLQNKRIKLQVWDTAGQQRFRTITQTYYKGAAGIFLVYSVGNRQSFQNISIFLIKLGKWMQQITEKINENVKVVLIANKIDLPDEPQKIQENNFPQFRVDDTQVQDNKINKGQKRIMPIICKADNFRCVSKKQGWDLASSYGIRYHEVSAKMNEKIDEIFYNMAEMIDTELEQELNNTVIEDNPSQDASYKISHSGTIELSTRGDKKTKIRSKRGIVYHKPQQISQKDSKANSMRYCSC